MKDPFDSPSIHSPFLFNRDFAELIKIRGCHKEVTWKDNRGANGGTSGVVWEGGSLVQSWEVVTRGEGHIWNFAPKLVQCLTEFLVMVCLLSFASFQIGRPESWFLSLYIQIHVAKPWLLMGNEIIHLSLCSLSISSFILSFLFSIQRFHRPKDSKFQKYLMNPSCEERILCVENKVLEAEAVGCGSRFQIGGWDSY